jgi:hypothetical protein
VVDSRQQRTMVERSPSAQLFTAEVEESAVVPDVRVVDMNVLAQVLDEVVAEVASKVPAPMKRNIGKRLQDAFRLRLAERGATAVTTLDTPSYSGRSVDGNPIAFYYRSNYRLFVELGGYYQSDLQRDDTRLFNALRNALKGKAWREVIAEADGLLRTEIDVPSILGRPLRDVEDLNDLLPARRGIEPRAVAGRPRRLRRPAFNGHPRAPLPLVAAE